MKSYWDLNNDEKKEYLRQAMTLDNMNFSLSNKVFVDEQIVIKVKNDVSSKRNYTEIKLLSIMGRRFEVINNILIIEKVQGENMSDKEMQNKNNILILLKKINDLQHLSIENISKYNYKDKMSKNAIIENKKIFEEVGADPNNIDRAMKIIEIEEESILSHSDLNKNNILINNKSGSLKSIELIDFEEVTIGNKYHDASTLIANWDFDNDKIKLIAKELDLNDYFLKLLSMLWCSRCCIWNTTKYNETNQPKYLKKANELKKRLKNIDYITKKHFE